ncbi:T9SS type A sorting domain-containing protein [Flavobacterium sp. AG291]|uniref:T9SS type A sorting domain-containing protein n=1 Tax=Flavobacterium sp. AG291 TaxID=2184000 RepID=UPI000E0A1C49|nr:T9SS type A sorting domain-containing protein [Flavobacterium sp. AG291]RDI11893.1 putative secreted protein (Por secretion system target) [Flavobacterium sp. AG291]
MKKTYLLILLFQILGYSQETQYLPAPANYGLNYNWYNDGGITPIYQKDNILYGNTKEHVGNTNVNHIVKINMDDDSIYIYPALSETANAYYSSPGNFKEKGEYIYFNTLAAIYRLNTTTNTIEMLINQASNYYLIGDNIVYKQNSSLYYTEQTKVYNITTNTTSTLTTTDNKNIVDIGGFYQSGDYLYFRGTSSLSNSVRNGIYRFNVSGSFETVEQYSFLSSVSVSQSYNKVVEVNGHLLYLMKGANGIYKYSSINLQTGLLNQNFTFSTGSTYVNPHQPIESQGIVYLTDFNHAVYSSNGIDTPQLTSLPLFDTTYFASSSRCFLNYNGNFYFSNRSDTYGYELWKTDFTTEGTNLVKDITAGTGSTFNENTNARVYQGKMYFHTSGENYNIYVSDGTDTGTVLLTLPGEFTFLRSYLFAYGNHIYFYGESPTGVGLYKIKIFEMEPLTLEPSQTNVSCTGANDGSATVNVIGGLGNYNYSWAPYGGSSASATGLEPGTYTVTVTDDFGSTASLDFTINEPEAITITEQPQTLSITTGEDASFTVESNAENKQWQMSTNGSEWVNLTDSESYIGTSTATLSIQNANNSLNGNYYRLQLSNAENCFVESASAQLWVKNNIDTIDDYYNFTNNNGSSNVLLGNIIDNDSFNGSTVNSNQVIISLTDDSNINGTEIDEEGNLFIPSNIQEGIYELFYSVCDINDASNCSEAKITIVVSAIAGINDPRHETLTVHPNPAKNYINITLSNIIIDKELNVSIYDINGRKIYDNTIINDLTSINVSELQEGVYIINIISDKGKFTSKFIKKN